MNGGLFKKGLLSYFTSNQATNYKTSDISNDDRVILLKENGGAGFTDILIRIGDLIASFGSEFDYIKFNNKNPNTVAAPPSGKYYMGIYDGWIWIKSPDGTIKHLYSQILQKEVNISGLSYVDFTPIILPSNSIVIRFNQIAEGYSISGTRVIFDVPPAQYEIIKVYTPYTIF